jgi:micrococcal nuclease
MTKYIGKVVYIIDGDTFDVKDERGYKHRIRLYGIDAPEKTQEFGGVAYEFLKELILNKEVHVDQKELGKYNRDVCIVHLKETGLQVNSALLTAGMAAASGKNHAYSAEFFTLQERARVERIGLWANDKIVNPSEYRKVNEHSVKKPYSEGTLAAQEDIRKHKEKKGMLNSLTNFLKTKKEKIEKKENAELSSDFLLERYARNKNKNSP